MPGMEWLRIWNCLFGRSEYSNFGAWRLAKKWSFYRISSIPASQEICLDSGESPFHTPPIHTPTECRPSSGSLKISSLPGARKVEISMFHASPHKLPPEILRLLWLTFTDDFGACLVHVCVCMCVSWSLKQNLPQEQSSFGSLARNFSNLGKSYSGNILVGNHAVIFTEINSPRIAFNW